MNAEQHTLMMRLLDGGLTPEEAERVRAQLLADPQTAATLQAHLRIQQRLGALGPVEAPGGFEARLQARLERAQQTRRWWQTPLWSVLWPVGILGGAALAGALLLGLPKVTAGPAGVAAAGLAPQPDAVPELVVRVRAAASVQAQAQQVLVASGLPQGGAEPVRMSAGAVRAAHARVVGQMPVELKGLLPAEDDAPVLVRVVVWGP
jgi:anti-sigma factor RsiW